MPGPYDEDSDTLLALDDDESSDDDGGRTLVVDRGAGERTQLETPLARLARKQAIEQAGLAPFRHVPAAGAPARPVTMGETPKPPAQPVPPETTAPFPRPQVDAADPERRVLPFSVGMQAPLSAPPPPHPGRDAGRASYADGFVPLTETLAMSNAPAMPRAQQAPVTMGETPNPPARPVRPMMPSPPPPRAPAPSAPPAAHASAAVPMGRTPMGSLPAAVVAPPPPAPRPRQDSVALAPETGTPPLVIRFLVVCGMLTALGLLALVYLEL